MMTLGKYTLVANFIATQYTQFEKDQLKHWNDDKIRENATQHCSILRDGMIELIGASQLTGGVRSPKLNDFVGGSPSSAHLAALASDEVPLEMTIGAAFRKLANSSLPYDQLIIEERIDKRILLPTFIIHLGSRRPGYNARRELFMQFVGDKRFIPYNPYDSRLPR